MTTCRHCGHETDCVRYGVRLPPMKVRILDAIVAHPGISTKEINRTLFDGAMSPPTIRVHVQQINDALVMTDVAIKGASGFGYRVFKRKVKGIA